jgi:hypothetical protein
MRRPRLIARLLLLVLAATFALADAAAFAAGARASANACIIGETHSPNTSWNSLQMKGLTVWQFLNPAECAACAGGPLLLNQVKWQFYTQCPVTFEVSVVGSDHAACPRPDTTTVLCPAFSYLYDGSGPPPNIAVIPFPPGCCIFGQAFVQVRVTDDGGCPKGRISFFVTDCNPQCRSYLSNPDFPLVDSCELLGTAPTVAVTADCCSGTPTHRPSWGRIKTLYR